MEDNIREWIGLEFAKSQRAVEEKRKWRKLVVKSFVVPSTTLAVMGWVQVVKGEDRRPKRWAAGGGGGAEGKLSFKHF